MTERELSHIEYDATGPVMDAEGVESLTDAAAHLDGLLRAAGGTFAALRRFAGYRAIVTQVPAGNWLVGLVCQRAGCAPGHLIVLGDGLSTDGIVQQELDLADLIEAACKHEREEHLG